MHGLRELLEKWCLCLLHFLDPEVHRGREAKLNTAHSFEPASEETAHTLDLG